ncbi:hypothetical protein [Streptomyces sp. NPDC005385]|uniref:hypothetical protein n=1 Tax=Streptomyces sp. NPDC005385 TaxID=3157039 RepID=UPI0033A39C2E
MWRVVVTSSTNDQTYVYEVDAPDYAPEEAVFDAACRQHGQVRRSGHALDSLDIRPERRTVELIRPQGA